MIRMEIYVLASSRTNEMAKLFLDTWARGFAEGADEYTFPQYAANPTATYHSPTELIEVLVRNPAEEYSIYWDNPDGTGQIAGGMLSFTSDGAMIVGINIYIKELDNGDVDRRELKKPLQDLAQTVNGAYGFWDFERPPPDTALEFIAIAKKAPLPSLVNGVLLEA